MAQIHLLNEAFNKKFEELLVENEPTNNRPRPKSKNMPIPEFYDADGKIRPGTIEYLTQFCSRVIRNSNETTEAKKRYYQDMINYMKRYLTQEIKRLDGMSKLDMGGYVAKDESLKEAFVFSNNIDKDILDGSTDENASNLMTNNNIKCSKSAINNLKFLLNRGHDASLCLGQLKKKDEDASNVISHVWVKYGDDIIQTHVPANLDSDVWEQYCIKEIKFNPSDLDDVDDFHDKVLSALNED